MFLSRLKSSDNIIDYILIFDVCKANAVTPAVLDYCYPSECSGEILNTLSKFVLPCSHRSSLFEHYTLLFTDVTAKIDFVVCLFVPLSEYVVCIKSVHPWFGLFHDLLNVICEKKLFTLPNRKELDTIVQRISTKAGLFFFDIPLSHPLSTFSSPIPDPRCHPHCHRYILEYYNALTLENWVLIFELMVLEKSVIFSSDRLNRTTSCILASLSLLYPLTWVHLIYPMLPVSCIDYISCPTPFIAGIHSCMLESARRLLTPDVFLVNLDENKVYSVGNVDTQMPAILRHWLFSRCRDNPPDFTQGSAPSEYVARRQAAIIVKPWMELWAAILGGYRKAIKYYSTNATPAPENIERFIFPSASNVMSPGGTTTLERPLSPNSVWLFDRQCFIESRGALCAAFLRRMLDSQMVIEYIRHRVALLNSEVGIIPSDDFEDLLSSLPYAPRSSLVQIMLHGRHKLEKLLKKLERLKDKPKKSIGRNKSNPTNLSAAGAEGVSSKPICRHHLNSTETLADECAREVELVHIGDEGKEERRGNGGLSAAFPSRVRSSHFVNVLAKARPRSQSTDYMRRTAAAEASSDAATTNQETDLITFNESPDTVVKSSAVVSPAFGWLPVECSDSGRKQYNCGIQIAIKPACSWTNIHIPNHAGGSDFSNREVSTIDIKQVRNGKDALHSEEF